MKKRIRDIRHEELIDSAIVAIYKHSYADVTMSEIAKEAGATAASINYYFGSKENLMAATMLRLMELLRKAVVKHLKMATTPEERILALVAASFDDALFNNAHCSVWVQFWSHSTHSQKLARLRRIDVERAKSNYNHALKELMPEEKVNETRRSLQAYVDGMWVQASDPDSELIPSQARQEARRLAKILLSQN